MAVTRMKRRLLPLGALVGGALAVGVTLLVRSRPAPEDRVAFAHAHRAGAVRDLFAGAGVPFPPSRIYLRVFKDEGQLEVWARDGGNPAFRFVHAFPILRSSGRLGPKRREGDRQVPEGFYRIDRFNPLSNYHLSLRIDYPNASDRIRSDPQQPGSDIYIHGGSATAGCLPVGDPGIETLYLIALAARERGQREIAVHIFPSHYGAAGWSAAAARRAAADPSLAAFWSELTPAIGFFEATRRVPVIGVAEDGRYLVEPDGQLLIERHDGCRINRAGDSVCFHARTRAAHRPEGP
jgi:murein L,D-transpeptidase YafK